MRTLTFMVAFFGLLLPAWKLTAEEPKPATAAPSGLFGEFTLVGGEKVIGLYHPERGVIEVYAAAKQRPVTAKDIVFRRRLSPEVEVEPRTYQEGSGRLHTLGSFISDGQAVIKRLENQRSNLEKSIQQRRLEISKRDEGNKVAEEALATEQDRERKAGYAALCTEHLKAIAAGHVAITDLEASIVAVDARSQAAVAELQDLQARVDWLQARILDMEPKRPAK